MYGIPVEVSDDDDDFFVDALVGLVTFVFVFRRV